MAEGLPEGLMAHSDNIAGEMQRLHDVDVEVVIKMWKGTGTLRPGSGYVGNYR